jgi:carbon storage regulator CsrA
MLVLARKQQQAIVIDDRITITVLKVKGNTVRLGFEAPADVSIRRSELTPLLVSEDGETKAA